MRKRFGYIFNFFWFRLGQTGFNFRKITKECIPFQLINNLVFIPVKVKWANSLLLDLELKKRYYSVRWPKEINLNNKETISLRGLGKEAIEGLKSTGNTLEGRYDF
jgi:hypothetical protein